jgi:DNA-binding transcriptional ArsR family regulator
VSPDDVRALSRAASQLAALAQPDVAALVAALPRRPGSTASLTDLGEASGLEMRTLGKAVARARDAGIIRVEGDRIGTDQTGPRDAVGRLVALTPLGALLDDRPDLAAHAPYGYVQGVPGGDHAEELLALLAAQLPEGELSEPEVSARLSVFGDDPAGLRRALVDSGFLWRTPDGSRYRRTG